MHVRERDANKAIKKSPHISPATSTNNLQNGISSTARERLQNILFHGGGALSRPTLLNKEPFQKETR